jgi:protease-4
MHVLRSPWFWVLVVVAALVLTTAVTVAVLVTSGPDVDEGSWLVVDLRDDLMEYDPPADLLSKVTGSSSGTLQGVLDGLAKAAVDERVAGVILKLGSGTAPGGASVQELRAGVGKVRDHGKRVVAWAESLGATGVHLTGACDLVAMCPTGSVVFTGSRVSSMHVKQLFEKLGIRPNLHKIKAYKSAAEMFTRTEMSEPAEENRRWLLEEAWRMRGDDLREELGLGAEDVERLMRHALFTGEQAKAEGFVDELWYWDDLESALKAEGEDELPTISLAEYREVDPADVGLEGDKIIAVVHAQGMIGGRKNGVNPVLGVMMGHESVNAELRRVQEDEDVAAVVFRIDSPGGSALTSDLIGHQVEVLAQSKPVVASMVDVAASGGYHIAYRASKIVASPMTVTGSIGSISGKFNMKGLYDKIGITHDGISKGPMAEMYSPTRDFTPDERARFEENHWASFDAWLTDVAEHRGMSFEQAEQLAHGRVWSGRQAVENGLVDELGGFDRAVELAKELAGIPVGERVTIVHYPKKKSLVEMLLGGDEDRTALAQWFLYRAIRADLGEIQGLATGPTAMIDPIEVH